MRVSHLELYAHCKKIFQACGVPYGYAEEGAETVANAEFLGLYGLQQLSDELPNLQSQLEELEIIEETDKVTVINGGKQSGMLLGKACADYVIARVKDRTTAVVSVHDTKPSRVLVQQAIYLSRNGLGSMILYKLPSHSSLIVSSPSSAFPIMIQKRNNQDIMDWINEELGLVGEKALTLPKEFTEFCIIGTKAIDQMDALIDNFQQAIDTSYIITSPEDFEQKWETSQGNGAEINQELWINLNEIGNQMLVESTDQSRLHGAGDLA